VRGTVKCSILTLDDCRKVADAESTKISQFCASLLARSRPSKLPLALLPVASTDAIPTLELLFRQDFAFLGQTLSYPLRIRLDSDVKEMTLSATADGKAVSASGGAIANVLRELQERHRHDAALWLNGREVTLSVPCRTAVWGLRDVLFFGDAAAMLGRAESVSLLASCGSICVLSAAVSTPDVSDPCVLFRTLCSFALKDRVWLLFDRQRRDTSDNLPAVAAPLRTRRYLNVSAISQFVGRLVADFVPLFPLPKDFDQLLYSTEPFHTFGLDAGPPLCDDTDKWLLGLKDHLRQIDFPTKQVTASLALSSVQLARDVLDSHCSRCLPWSHFADLQVPLDALLADAYQSKSAQHSSLCQLERSLTLFKKTAFRPNDALS
jgi:hypothetical protein